MTRKIYPVSDLGFETNWTISDITKFFFKKTEQEILNAMEEATREIEIGDEIGVD